jgi:hypothetical protein
LKLDYHVYLVLDLLKFILIPFTADHVTVNFARSGGPGGQNVNKGFIVFPHSPFCHSI